MENFPQPRKLGEIPDAERVDMNDSPVTREEMREAVRALNDDSVEKIKPLLEVEKENEEVRQALHKENPEENTQFD